MPVGTFLPWDDADTEGRFFARPVGFECECPCCGRLFLVGPGRRDTELYNRVSGILTCPLTKHPGRYGCGRQWLIGIVAYQIQPTSIHKRPLDQRPNARQLNELRNWGRGVWAKRFKKRGEALNVVRRDPNDPGEPPRDDEE